MLFRSKPPVAEILKSKISVFVELHNKNAELMRENAERRQAEEQLRASEENLRALAAHLQRVREEEWTRIAREIHDELGQVLTGLKMDLSWIAKRLSPQQTALTERTSSMAALIDESVDSVRRIASQLRPEVLDQLGLAAAIGWQADDFKRRTGIRCSVSLPPAALTLDHERSIAAFRIVQELLTNVARHANATRVEVSIRSAQDALTIEIEDDGKGIEPDAIHRRESLGLLGMRERVLPFGGSIEITAPPDGGTRAFVSIPFGLR